MLGVREAKARTRLPGVVIRAEGGGRREAHRDRLLLASIRPEGSRHDHLDDLGTPRVVTDGFGVIQTTHDYYPFGREATPCGPGVAPLRFTGHERDTDRGCFEGNPRDYMHARYYSVGLGRFLSVDPVLDTAKALKEPQRWNRYTYVINNPMRYTDPDGREIYAQVHEVTSSTTDYLGVQPSHHVSIRIEPADQSAWSGDSRFSAINPHTGRRYATIGAGPEHMLGGALVADVNRPTDVNLSDKVSVKLELGGKDENKVIGQLFATAAAYKNDKRYQLYPKPNSNGYNSNSFASGLIRAVGLVPPTLRMNVPGYSKPLPLPACPQGPTAPCR